MHVILFLLAMFVPAVCFSQTLDIEKFEVRQEKAIIPLLIGIALVSLAVGIYTFLQMRKMQKKNRPKPNQIDGTIADEGVSFCDIAGSPHIHPNITDLWNKKSEAIKQKSGGFLGIGKTSQVTGYRYYTSFAAFIGNRIEKFIAINFDNRGWIVHDPTKHPFNMLPVNEPSLFGQDAGGVVGNIDIEFGYPQPQQNLAYKQHFDLVSAYPYQSYLVFRGNTIDQPFYFGNSNYMKEMLLWVKRTRVRNDGQGQWYATTPERPWVCEIGDVYDFNVDPSTNGSFTTTVRELIGTTYSPQENYSKIVNHVAGNNQISSTWRGLGSVSSGPNNEEAIAIRSSIDGGIESTIEVNATAMANGLDLTLMLLGVSDSSILSLKVTTHNDPRYPFSLQKKLYAVVDMRDVGTLTVHSRVDGRDLTGSYNIHLDLSTRYSEFYGRGRNYPINAYDINPIHKIREILTDDTAMAKPEADVNDHNFVKAANQIWDEGLGVSWAIDEKSCIDAIEELCYHIEAGIRVNRQTGLYEMVLFRDDWFAEDEIHTIAENKIKDLSLEVMNSDDIVNQLNVTYYDRGRIKNSTFSIYENGSILTMGKANAESIDFPYFMNMRNAEAVANWKLKQYSTPVWKGTLTTGWREARKWNRYDLVKINWSKKWQGTILARIMKIDLGNGLNNEVMIDFEEVVPYSGEMNTSIVVDDSTEEKAEPAKPAIGETFEAPYYIAVQNIGQRKVDEDLAYNQDAGFTFSTYRRPQWNALYAEITTANVDKPEDGWIIDGNAEFVTSGQFDQLVSRTMTQIPVKNLQIEGSLNQGDLIVVGSWIIGSVGQYEFMIIESFDAETNILTVKRGALDTIPFEWGIDTNFWNSSLDDGLFSLTEYSAGDNVRASALTVTPSSKLEHLGSAPVYMRSRAIRPYPPANVKINGEYFPNSIVGDINLSWSHRNRLSLNKIDWFSSVTDLESGTTFSLNVYRSGVLFKQYSEMQSNELTIVNSELEVGDITLELYSVRDGYSSFYFFSHTFQYSPVDIHLIALVERYRAHGVSNQYANITIDIDESLKANMNYDGLSIVGKSEAGATITIEVIE